MAGSGGGQLVTGGGARHPRQAQALGSGLVPNRDSSASLNTWLGREGSRPASVQGEELLGAEKVPAVGVFIGSWLRFLKGRACFVASVSTFGGLRTVRMFELWIEVHSKVVRMS